jgi:hypothetical protein
MDLLQIFFMLLVVSIEVYPAHRVEGDRRGNFLLQEGFIGIFAEPWMSQNLFHAMHRT